MTSDDRHVIIYAGGESSWTDVLLLFDFIVIIVFQTNEKYNLLNYKKKQCAYVHIYNLQHN